jgi:hypothetical protein
MVFLPLLRESATYTENGESVPASVGGLPMSICTGGDCSNAQKPPIHSAQSIQRTNNLS